MESLMNGYGSGGRSVQTLYSTPRTANALESPLDKAALMVWYVSFMWMI